MVIFATVPLMAFKLERYRTSSSRERAIHLKLFCFQARERRPYNPRTVTLALRPQALLLLLSSAATHPDPKVLARPLPEDPQLSRRATRPNAARGRTSKQPV